MRTRRTPASLGFIVLFALSCGRSPDGPPPAAGPALKITAGAGVSDTISASLGQALVVQVQGQTGQPESGVAVVFDAPPTPCAYYQTCSGTLLGPARDGSLGSRAAAATDAQGRAAVYVRMGTWAGPVSVKITVPLYGLADSAAFTVLPGAAVGVGVSPRDTALDLGATFGLRAGLVDRAGNVRSEPVTFEATSPAVQVSGSGSVSAVAVGRAYVRVRGAVGGVTRTDSAGITVAPKVRLAVAEEHGHLYLESLAGGAARLLLLWERAGIVWSPTGDRIAYFNDSGLAITDTLGQATAVPTVGVSGPSWPEYSRDGRWIYFSGDNGNGTQIFRVHPDGTGLEALQSPSSTDYGSYPSPSPDGTRVAYTNYSDKVLVKTFATGHVDTLTATGFTTVHHARWSPDGQWIAFTRGSDGRIGVIRPDGSGVRIPGGYAPGGVSWSPDSRFLVGGWGYLGFTDVAAGSAWGTTTRGYYAAWRP